MRKVPGLALAAAMAVFLSGCAATTQHTKDKVANDVMMNEKIDKKIIEVRGMAAADLTMENEMQRKATSEQAAVVDAQYKLTTMIKGVKIEGGNTIEKAMLTDSVIAATVNAEIKGAEIISTEWTRNKEKEVDGCIVMLRLDLNGLAKRVGLKLAQ
jgi:hypothetical protein